MLVKEDMVGSKICRQERALEVHRASRVLVIGIDGATFDVIDPLLEQGELPNIGQLLHQGVRSNLLSTFPPITAQAWTTFATGQHAGLHGLFDFVQKTPGQYRREVTNATHCRSRTVWEILSEKERDVVVANVPMTYPVRPVQGVMVSGFGTPGRGDEATFPPSLAEDLRVFESKDSLDGVSEAAWSGDMASAVPLLERGTEQTLGLAEHLLSRVDWSFGVVVFSAADKAQHYFWKYMDTHHPLHPGPSPFENVIAETYKQIDAAIGELVADYGDDVWVMLMSDHGFGPVSDRAIHLNALLAKHGYLRYEESRVMDQLTRPSLGWVRKVRKLIPDGLWNRLKGLPLISSARDTLHSAEYWNDIDFESTVAFADERRGAVWINVKDREAKGIVPAGSECDRLIGEISEMLREELRDPKTGNSLVNQIMTKKELFPVDVRDVLPDLIVDLSIAPVFSFRPSSRFFADSPRYENRSIEDTPAVRIMPKSEVEGLVINGDHRMDGIFVLSNPDLDMDAQQLPPLGLEDVAPTILHLLTEPIPAGMTGGVPSDLLDLLRKYGYKDPVSTDESLLRGGEAPAAYDAEEEQAVVKRLEDLGYL